jgi:MFS family permease
MVGKRFWPNTEKKLSFFQFLTHNAAMVGIAMNTTLLFAFITLYVRDFIKASNFKVGLVIGLVHLTTIAISPLAGYLSDAVRTPWGRRRPFLFVGALASALLLLLMPQVRDYYLFLPLIVLFSILSVGYQVPFYALIPEVAPVGMRGAYTIFTALLRLVGFVLVLGLGSLVWRRNPAYPFYITALFVVVSSLITVFSVREENNLVRRAGGVGSSFLERARTYLFDLIQQREILLFLTAQFFWWLGLGAVIPFVTILMKEFYGIDISQFLRLSPLAFLAAALMVLFVVLSGILGDRWGHRQVITTGLLILTLGSVTLYLFRSLEAIYVVGALMAIGAAALINEPLAFLAELVPKGREGEFYGLDTLSSAASQAPAALLGGAVIDWLGYPFIFLFAAGCLILAVVFMLLESDTS